jgi:hypothetical protein
VTECEQPKKPHRVPHRTGEQNDAGDEQHVIPAEEHVGDAGERVPGMVISTTRTSWAAAAVCSPTSTPAAMTTTVAACVPRRRIRSGDIRDGRSVTAVRRVLRRGRRAPESLSGRALSFRRWWIPRSGDRATSRQPSLHRPDPAPGEGLGAPTRSGWLAGFDGQHGQGRRDWHCGDESEAAHRATHSGVRRDHRGGEADPGHDHRRSRPGHWRDRQRNLDGRAGPEEDAVAGPMPKMLWSDHRWTSPAATDSAAATCRVRSVPWRVTATGGSAVLRISMRLGIAGSYQLGGGIGATGAAVTGSSPLPGGPTWNWAILSWSCTRLGQCIMYLPCCGPNLAKIRTVSFLGHVDDILGADPVRERGLAVAVQDLQVDEVYMHRMEPVAGRIENSQISVSPDPGLAHTNW